MNDYMIELPARLHLDDLQREVARSQRSALLGRHPARERLAGALVELAAWLAPASQAAPARRIIKTGQPA